MFRETFNWIDTFDCIESATTFVLQISNATICIMGRLFLKELPLRCKPFATLEETMFLIFCGNLFHRKVDSNIRN